MKAYIDEHRAKKKAKNVFGKTMENGRKHRDIKLLTTETKRKYLVSRPNYRTTKIFFDNLLAIEIKRTQILIKK